MAFLLIFYNSLFLDMKNVITIHIIEVIRSIIQNPFGLLENGMLMTFIPKNPDIIVGIEKISVTTVKICITLF